MTGASLVQRVKVLLAVDVPAFRSVDAGAEFRADGSLDTQALTRRIKAGADAGKMKDFTPDWGQITGLRVIHVLGEHGAQLAEDLRIEPSPVDAGLLIERAILDARIDPMDALTEVVRFCRPGMAEQDVEAAVRKFIERLAEAQAPARRVIPFPQHR
jgi:hypothetical protein